MNHPRKNTALVVCLSLFLAMAGAGASLTAMAADSVEQVFRFSNSSEPETLDPGKATGFPEFNLFLSLFEGLTTLDAKTLDVQPGVAKSWQISDGGKRYTFLLRDDAKWSNGRRVVAADFVYAWRRLLEPANKAAFARHLFYLKGARDFNAGTLKDFQKVGLHAVSDDVLEVELEYPTPYFLFLCAFYALMPVPHEAIEQFGTQWTTAQNIVVNGPFNLQEWKPRQQIILKKSPTYWDRNAVSLQQILVYPIESKQTAYNLYMQGKLHWTGQTSLPESELATLKKRPDYHEPLRLGNYFLRFNVKRAPMNNEDVRKALYLAIDRDQLVANVTRTGETPAYSFTPDGMKDYQPPKGPTFNPAKAVSYLNKAGYCVPSLQVAKCKPFPEITILYNTNERHKVVLLAVKEMWKRYLGIDKVVLQNREWKDYLQAQRAVNFTISRSGWVADYPDPLAFIEIFTKGGANNLTNWSNDKYDALIQSARSEFNPETRSKNLVDAETILLNELPIIPLYYITSPFLLDVHISGFYENILDLHPLKSVYIKGDLNTEPTN